MKALVDTNVLLRLRDVDSPEHTACREAIRRLCPPDNTLFVCTQVMIEFWVVATRPRNVNGAGLTPQETGKEIATFEQMFVWLPEPPDIGARWRKLVTERSVIGKQAHDTRLVALMNAHGLTHLFTLNPADFARYNDITRVLPADVR